MALYSTLPAVETALLASLQAQSALSGIQVTETHPGDTIQTECVYLGDAKATEIIPVSRGARVSRQEDYVLDVWIDCTCAGPDATQAVQRAYLFFGAVEDSLSNDPTLGHLDGVIKAYVSDWEVRKGFDDNRRAWACQLKISVAVESRLV